ncbi:sigma-70 family RNA polymerase sigma factor [Luteolibacter soli]|uniref:Sigma-70 family RNA polymerase sigma factor n=1 Tax=Luteolibacter soli TaxID=3135280 RepID=A0ABU9ATT4_9BACT
MNHDSELDARERLTRHWLESEPAVRAYVFAAVRAFHDAEDVVQQVALTVARRFEEYDEKRPFVGWALWLAKSRVIDHFRKQGRDRLVFSETLLDQMADALVQRQPEGSARQAAMERCIAKLPEKSRQLLELRYEEGSSMERVAAAVDSTAAAVRVMLFRIRNLLAGCIQTELGKEAR